MSRGFVERVADRIDAALVAMVMYFVASPRLRERIEVRGLLMPLF
jgi:hypothetical protein